MEAKMRLRVTVGLLLTVLAVISTGLALHLSMNKSKIPSEDTIKIQSEDDGLLSNRELVKSRRGSASSRLRSVNRTVEEKEEKKEEVVDITEIYTDWSRWTRCSRRCKQRRERQCAVPEVCGSAVVKMERGCHSERCRGRDFHIVRKKKLGRKTKNQIKRKRAFYSKWTRWSQCSDLCLTTRVKSCRFPVVCGSVQVTEEAYCYTTGSQCEAWYKAGKSLDIGDQTGSKARPEQKVAAPVRERVKENSRRFRDYQAQCGSREINRPHRQRSHATDIAMALRIIGGVEAGPGRWPWQIVLLNKYREAFCGGTLIHPRWVLTAAHCVRKHLVVRVGEHDLVVHEGSEREYVVKRSILHPQYNRDTVDSDVALLELPEMVELGSKAAVACLPDQDESLPTEDHCTIIGWGKEKKSHFFGTEVLHEARVPIVSMKDCMSVYKNYYITDNMFCAGYRGGRIDSCAGDSGGPLLCQRHNRWTIYGITSFGEGCGRQGKYGIYAKVPNYSKWIERTIEMEESKH